MTSPSHNMKAKRDDSLRAIFERSQAARRAARAKVSEVLGKERSELSKRALLQRQRAARKAIEEALEPERLRLLGDVEDDQALLAELLGDLRLGVGVDLAA